MKTYYFIPIKQLKLSRLFDKIFVSTEDKALKKIAESYGAKVDFLRSKKLSKDKTPLILVLKNALRIKKRGEVYDEIWMIYACNPLLSKKI